ncbi:MAG: hypothetical protein VKK80_06155 [Prochlorothrix sp.]|nr:hypothetical protein [Prochlorothrix sp.]
MNPFLTHADPSSNLAGAAGKSNLNSPYKRLGERLLAAGLITRFQLEMALQEQLSTRKRLGEIVVAKGWVELETVEGIAADRLSILSRKSVRSQHKTKL